MASLDSKILTKEHVERAFRFLIPRPDSSQLTCQDLKQSLIRSGAIFPSASNQTTSFRELQQELEQEIHKTASLDLKLKRRPHTHAQGQDCHHDCEKFDINQFIALLGLHFD
jgi:hypothetical protein